MSYVEEIKEELKKCIKDEKAAYLPKFFQAFEGGYGEGDRFLGVVVPDQRKVARKHYQLVSMRDIEKLLNEPYHEYSPQPFLLWFTSLKIKVEKEKKK